MEFPPHTRMPLTIVGLTIALAVFGTVSVVRARALRPWHKTVVIVVMVGVLALVVGWVVFVLPAHWD